MADDNSALIAAGGAIGGSALTFLGHWVTGWFKKVEAKAIADAQTEQTLAQAIDAKLKVLMAGQERRIEDLTEQVNVQDRHIGALTRHIIKLTHLLSSRGLNVPPVEGLVRPEMVADFNSGIPSD